MGLLGRIYILIVLAVVPAFALLTYVHYQDYRQHQSAGEEAALRSARLVAAELEQILQSAGRILSAAAVAPAVVSLEEPGCSSYLRRLQEISPSQSVFAVAVASDGTVRCGGTPGLSIADRPYFAAALQSQGPVIGEYTIGRTSGVTVLPVALRIQTSEGPGVMATGVRLDWLREHFARRYSEFPPQSSLTITDRHGVILVRLPNREREGTRLSRYQFLTESRTGGTFRSRAEHTADGVARFVGFTSPHQGPAAGLAVAVGLPLAPVLAESRAAAIRDFLLLGLIALLTFVTAALGGRLFIHRPVSHLLRVIDDWRNGKMSVRAKPSVLPRQFAQIGSAFNEMAAELEGALHHKDLLLRELNHRMMNSLASVSALLRMQSYRISDPDSRRLFDNAVSRMEALTLVYRRIQAAGGVEAVDFGAFLSDLCRDIQDSMMRPGASCVADAVELQLPPAQATPLALIVNELVTNAVKHGAPQAGSVNVSLRHTNGSCRLAVRNSGSLPEGYAPERTSGFGMRMVTAMVQQIGGEIEAATTAGETEFAVTFAPASLRPVPVATPAAGAAQ